MGDTIAAMYRARVIRLYPTPEQAERLSSWVGAVRFVYNLALQQRTEFYRPGRSFNFISQGRELSALRKEADWLSDVPRDCLDQALRDLDQAFRNWWDGRAERPRFRTRGSDDSLRIPKPRDCQPRTVTARWVMMGFPKIGEVRGRLTRPLNGALRNVTIFRRASQWFAAVLMELPADEPRRLDGEVGIDRGVRVFAALSNGEMIAGPNAGRKAMKALARAQRKLARKQEGSRNREKQRRRVARMRMRVANARKDFLHKVSTSIAKSHGVVVMEDLRIGNMTRSAKGDRENPGRNVRQKAGLNRSILDQGWGMFHRFLAYKLAERGGELVLVPANDTSRTCAACGVVDKESRKAERFKCTACGHEDDADLNAAINILRRGRASVLPAEGGLLESPVEAGTSGRAA